MASLTLNFTAPAIPPVNGYIVKYRKVGDPTYITVSPNPSSSPVVITDLELAEYEGTVQSDCEDINSSEVSFLTNAPPPLPTFDFNGPWEFTDTGALNLTDTRTYNQNTMVANALWVVSDGGYGLRINWEDSQNCSGTNAQTQSGTATVGITVNTAQLLGINWTGLAELQSTGFENMTIKVDTTTIGTATSAGGSLGCVMGDIVSTNLYPDGYPLSEGTHTISITTSTTDPLYHVGSFYAFTFTKLD